MANKKLTLSTALKVAGVGELVEKTIHFIDADGEAYEGEILVKRLSHEERIHAIDAWGLEDNSKATVDHYSKAILFQSIYTAKDEKFFSTIEETGLLNAEIIAAMSEKIEEVNDFMGKKWISNQKNSGANSLSTESVEEPLSKPSET